MKNLETSSSTLTATSNGEVSPEQVRTVLMAARKLIEKPQNWCQGIYFRGSQCCSVGAITKAMRLFDVYDPDVKEVVSVLASGAGCSMSEVGSWNDKHTHTEVLAAFDKAIASLSHSDDRVSDSNTGS